MNFKVCTTWHKTGYKKYGDHFIQGFCQNWPTQVDLTIYAEEHEPIHIMQIILYWIKYYIPDLKSMARRTKITRTWME